MGQGWFSWDVNSDLMVDVGGHWLGMVNGNVGYQPTISVHRLHSDLGPTDEQNRSTISIKAGILFCKLSRSNCGLISLFYMKGISQLTMPKHFVRQEKSEQSETDRYQVSNPA